MKPFKMVTSRITPLPEPNIDTDQIIPKQFLKMISRSGFGRYLFHDRRRDMNGNRLDFVLDNPVYKDSRILVAGDNFGCGSSREHAVWALQDFGFSVVVSSSFADIFYSNCIKNGVLPVRLDGADIEHVIVQEAPVTVDLQTQSITTKTRTVHFCMDPYKRTVLLEGLDEIAQTLGHEEAIAAFESVSAYPSVR